MAHPRVPQHGKYPPPPDFQLLKNFLLRFSCSPSNISCVFEIGWLSNKLLKLRYNHFLFIPVKAASFSVFSLVLVTIFDCNCRLCFTFKSFFLQLIHISGHNDLVNDASAEGELILVVLWLLLFSPQSQFLLISLFIKVNLL